MASCRTYVKGWQNNPYSTNTLIGNWDEDRFDIKEISKGRCLPSAYDQCFETTYKKCYSNKLPGVPEVLKYSKGKKPSAHPGHQPVLDLPKLKADYSPFITTSMEAYKYVVHT